YGAERPGERLGAGSPAIGPGHPAGAIPGQLPEVTALRIDREDIQAVRPPRDRGEGQGSPAGRVATSVHRLPRRAVPGPVPDILVGTAAEEDVDPARSPGDDGHEPGPSTLRSSPVVPRRLPADSVEGGMPEMVVVRTHCEDVQPV